MRSLQKEKLDHADTAFLMYENALRKTCKLMDELKPEEQSMKEPFIATKLIGGMDGKLMVHDLKVHLNYSKILELDIEDEVKPINRSKRNKSNKNKKIKEEPKPDIKMAPV